MILAPTLVMHLLVKCVMAVLLIIAKKSWSPCKMDFRMLPKTNMLHLQVIRVLLGVSV